MWRPMHDSLPAQPRTEPIPFVGRTWEIGIVQRALEQAMAGDGRIVLISGEPGIGKTRTAMQVVAIAQSSGCQVHWSACDEWDGAPAYWPWVRIIRSIIQQRGVDELLELLGADGADIAQIVPELQERLARPLHRSTGEEAARFRLFDAISTFLTALAREAPLVVVLDDLHWADTPSVLLLQFIAQHLRSVPLLILGTYRHAEVGPGQPLADVLGELARNEGCVRVALAGLTLVETGDVITSVAGHPLPARIVDVVQHETEGNPFFVSEIARYLTGERGTTQWAERGGLHFSVPETIKDVIGRRLRRLPEACQELLSIASVIGREFSLRVLADVSEQQVEVVLERLDDALQSQLIDPGPTIGAYRFHHALVQETLYDLLPRSRRLMLHRKVGQGLARLTSPAADPPLDELSFHFFQAAPLGDVDTALSYASRAAERAMRILAWENAAEHYRRALQVFDLATGTTARNKCELLLALGDAQTLAERSPAGSPEARDTFLLAADLARLSGLGEHFARAALGFAGRNFVVTPGGAQQVTLLEEALVHLGLQDSILRVLVLSRLAIDRSEFDIQHAPRLRLDPESRFHQLNDEAISIARRIGDPRTIARALLAKYVACSTHDNLAQRIALASEAVAVAAAVGDVEFEWWGTAFLLWDYAEAGDIEHERQALATMFDVTRKAPTPFREWGAFGQLAQVALREGDYVAAEAHALRSIGDLPLLLTPWHFFHLRREQDRLPEIEDALQRMMDIRTVWKTRDAILVLTAVDLGWSDAQGRFDALAAQGFRDLPVTERLLHTLALLAEACVELADRQRAQQLYDLLLPYAGRPLAVLIHAIHLGAVSQYLGKLATLLSEWDAAERHFADALKLNERLNLRPYAAHTRHAWADMLVKRGDPAGHDRARELNAEALAVAREIGMARLQRLAEALDARIAAVVPVAPDSPTETMGLSRREVEVFRLIGAGKSNREIADELFLSVRTVERHVENVYRKLDVRSRAEAIAVALRQSSH